MFYNFIKAVLAGTAVFLGVQVGRDLAHKTMAATSTPSTGAPTA
jgi:hypothetical protein